MVQVINKPTLGKLYTHTIAKLFALCRPNVENGDIPKIIYSIM